MASVSTPRLPVSFHVAFDRLRDTITPDDARLFSSTTMEDVWVATRSIEHQLEARQSLRGLRRIEPFLSGIEQYVRVVEVLCNGTPYLSFIWAPIKLLLQIAQGQIYALERLIEAYMLIGEAMPRFDKLSAAFKDDTDFHQVMGLFYADILEFHRRAYKFFRRSAWKLVFESLWKTFDLRFQAILDSLRKHRDLIDHEANTRNIVEAREWRAQQLQQNRQWKNTGAGEIDRVERDRSFAQIREATAWFNATGAQEDVFDKLWRASNGRGSNWILQDSLIVRWLRPSRDNAVIWLNGKPGAGKSVICSQIIQHIQEETDLAIVYYFCNSNQLTQGQSNEILKTFATQLLAANTDIASYVIETFANHSLRPTTKHLRAIIEKMISVLPAVRVVVDGLDECSEEDQQEVLENVLKLEGRNLGDCKILISSRKLPSLMKVLQNRPTLRLEDNAEHVNSAITAVVSSRLAILRHNFREALIDELEQRILSKADGMFLWVKLVLSTLEHLYSEHDIQLAIDTLPEGLEAIYCKILQRICGDGKTLAQRKAIRILQWMLVARRSLRKFEIESGIVLDDKNVQINESTKVRGDPLVLCNPMLYVEDGPGGAVSFVHFTAKEYLLGHHDNRLLNQPQAHFVVGLSCVLYLISSFDLIDPRYSEHETQSKVLNGLYDMHLYASDHWCEHMLHVAQAAKHLSRDPLLALNKWLSKLTHLHEEALINNGRAKPDDYEHSDPAIDGVLATSDIPHASRALISDLLVFRKRTAEGSEDLEQLDIDAYIARDPTLFSKIRFRYQGVVENLLEGIGNVDRAASASLSCFKARHGSGAFMCRYQSCPRSSHGFASASLRQDHEIGHTPLFQCTNTECAFRGWTFKTQGAMNKHANQYHEVKDVGRIPDSLSLMKPKSNHSSELSYSNNPSSRTKSLLASAIPDSISGVSSQLGDLNIADVSPNFKKEGEDWFAIFNPVFGRTLDVHLIHTFMHQSVVSSTCFSPDGRLFATCGNRTINIFDIATGTEVMSFQTKTQRDQVMYFRDICFSPDGRYLAAAGEDRLIKVWDVATQLTKYTLSGHEDDIYSLAFGSSGQLLASGSGDRTARLWSLEGSEPVILQLDDGPASISLSPDDRYLACGCLDNLVWIWDVLHGRNLTRLRGHTDCIYGVIFMPDGNRVLSASLDKTIKLWDWTLEESQCLRTFGGHKDFSLCVASSQSPSSWFVSGSKDRNVYIWDHSTGDALLRLEGHKNDVVRVAVNSSGTHFATASGDRRARVWSITSWPQQQAAPKTKDSNEVVNLQVAAPSTGRSRQYPTSPPRLEVVEPEDPIKRIPTPIRHLPVPLKHLLAPPKHPPVPKAIDSTKDYNRQLDEASIGPTYATFVPPSLQSPYLERLTHRQDIIAKQLKEAKRTRRLAFEQRVESRQKSASKHGPDHGAEPYSNADKDYEETEDN